ncbi:hypothetical protein DLL80_23835 [Salmonella enterica subsp. enterica serovar Newport]|uniref:Uncharacterized protein n=1 Tax=Salmonella newport TaxID=108619 RepID=A0A5V6RMI4_SALNE|nr:hypothetical protein [Salmonella enterica subsp. enterica serovar Newport]
MTNAENAPERATGALVTLPTTRAAWRETFKDGVTWEAVELAYQCGLMREERYNHAFAHLLKGRVVLHGDQQVAENERAKAAFRYFWEPKHFPGE